MKIKKVQKKKMKTKLFKCEKCNMKFTEEIRLKRHYTKAHPSKPEHYKQKWYWENQKMKTTLIHIIMEKIVWRLVLKYPFLS